MRADTPPFDMDRITYHSFDGETRLVQAEKLVDPNQVLRETSKVTLYPASDINRLAAAIVENRKAGHEVVVGMGAHLIKLGLGPLIADLVRRKLVTAVAMNGAAAFHDMELCVFGATSENVDKELPAGRFGFASEPADMFNESLLYGSFGHGTGYYLGKEIVRLSPALDHCSVLATCYREDVLATVHVAIGTDVVHLGRGASPESQGAAAFIDFHKFITAVYKLVSQGGVYVNIGSAVVMPEVFLKAVSVAVNVHGLLEGSLLTANLDMIDHYRPRTNVLRRVCDDAIDIRMRHEDSIPILYRALVLAKESK
jgi:hypothetical protein